MTRETYGQAYQNGFVRTVRFLVSRGVPQTVALDVAQSAWTKGWEKLDQLRSESMVFTWVNTIAMNAYRQLLRKEPSLEELPELPAPEESLATIDVGRVFRICRPSERLLFERRMRGETTAEIARKEGVTKTAIRIRLLRALRRVRSEVVRIDAI